MFGLWLRMAGYVNAGGFTIPSSEVAYNANGIIADAVYPAHGGTLQADGTWTQDAGMLGNAFSLALPGTASGWGQLYLPGVFCDQAGILTVLDSEELSQTAAANLLTLAQSSRFDSPWDGVFLDLENVRLDYRDKLSVFFSLLATTFHDAGLLIGISVNGKRIDGGDWVVGSSRYTYDYVTIGDLFDYVDMRCYGYPGAEYTANARFDYMGPYWWIEDCIAYALSAGIPQSKLMVGVGNFSRYWETIGVSSSVTTTHADAITLCTDDATYPLWVETDGSGRVREQYADLGADQVWVHDHNAIKHPLGLIDDNDLLGLNLFTPGMGNADIWTAIDDWLPGYTPWHGYIAVENLNLTAPQFATLLTIIKGQGRQSDDQPAYITHSRTVSVAITVTEAVFRYGEMAQDQCIQWLATVLEVDPADVTLAEAADVWTLAHGGTDYVTIELFGGLDSDWDTSGAACRAYLA